jgi:hypothetical protein
MTSYEIHTLVKVFKKSDATYQQLRRENIAHFDHQEQPKYQGLVLALIFGFPENQIS